MQRHVSLKTGNALIAGVLLSGDRKNRQTLKYWMLQLDFVTSSLTESEIRSCTLAQPYKIATCWRRKSVFNDNRVIKNVLLINLVQFLPNTVNLFSLKLLQVAFWHHEMY